MPVAYALGGRWATAPNPIWRCKSPGIVLKLTDFAADVGSGTRKTYAGSGFPTRAPGERIVGPDCWLETKTAQVIVTKGVTSLFPEKSASLS